MSSLSYYHFLTPTVLFRVTIVTRIACIYWIREAFSCFRSAKFGIPRIKIPLEGHFSENNFGFFRKTVPKTVENFIELAKKPKGVNFFTHHIHREKLWNVKKNYLAILQGEPKNRTFAFFGEKFSKITYKRFQGLLMRAISRMKIPPIDDFWKFFTKKTQKYGFLAHPVLEGDN